MSLPDSAPHINQIRGAIGVESNLAALRARVQLSGTVNVAGYASASDGGGGDFYWDALSTEADNSVTIIQPNSLPAAGRWKRSEGRITPQMCGAKGDGVTPDDAALIVGASLINTVSKGTFLITSPIAFVNYLTINQGAKFKVQGAGNIIFNGIAAGEYKIIETDSDFINNPIANTKVKINLVPIKGHWFCDVVQNADDILTVPDQTNNLTVAYRAAVGNYSVQTSPTSYNTQDPKGVLDLGTGYYRIDKTFRWGHQISGNYYRVTGFKMIGNGVNAAYLVRTNMASTDYVLFGAFYTGELTVADGFKVTAYNPSGATSQQKFSSAAKTMVFFQGDSLRIGEIWVSGAQVPIINARGVKRNGVGIQFESCIDTFFETIFTELCVTPIAFSSSIVSGNNLEIYKSAAHGIGLGNFTADWPDVQSTSSVVTITNTQMRDTTGSGIVCQEVNSAGELYIGELYADGRDIEFGGGGAANFIEVLDGANLLGGLGNVVFKYYTGYGIKLQGTARAGNAAIPFNMSNVVGVANLADSGAFVGGSAAAYVNIKANCLTLQAWTPVLLNAPNSGNFEVTQLHLSDYIGKADAGANRQLFVSGGTCRITLRDVTRNASDTTALNQIGFAAGGDIFLDIQNLPNATRVVYGGATVKMPSYIPFA